MTKSTLVQIYANHQGKVSDKWSIYLTEYERVFKNYRGKSVNLLEIGIQNGGSLEIWSKYFHNAKSLVGCDINPDCARLSYDDPRIAIVVGDANSDSAQEAILDHASTFDFIIDDGSHLSRDIVKSFARYFPHLVDGGVFIVEDLHTSYWQEFEGGLFDPFSSINFFKRLVDVINHEHWGIGKARTDILGGFFAKYGFHIETAPLHHIHSIEFINSMCIIRKAKPDHNWLGTRVIAGAAESIVPGHLGLNGLLYSLDPVLIQTSNEWTARNMPPDEELIFRNKELSDHKQALTELKQALADRDILIANYQNSWSWRITKPLRFLSRVYTRITRGN